MERRELIQILGAAAALPAEAQSKPRFFTAAEYETIDKLTEIIIPTDAQSPGAHAANVRFYIDTILLYANAGQQATWRKGLSAVNTYSKKEHAAEFNSLPAASQMKVMEAMAANEKAPKSDIERFFGPLKALTIEAFSLSEVGMTQYFGYKGHHAVSEFSGCTHKEHKA